MLYDKVRKIFTEYSVCRICRMCNKKEIDYDNLKEISVNNKECILIDVRSPQEYKEWHIDGSINIPVYNLKKTISIEIPNKEYTIIVYCQTGSRSKKAVDILIKMGYTNIFNLKGGLDNIN